VGEKLAGSVYAKNGGVVETDKEVAIDWLDAEGITKSAVMPRIIFTR
jgi:hypothetical protein